MLRDGPISTEWDHGLAYVVGLFASDGNLSRDGRHLNLTSKDLEVLERVKEILQIQNKIGVKARSVSGEKKYFVLQFGSKDFHSFLQSIGLTPAKSKTIGPLLVPDEYFGSFLRGCIDGDGNIQESIHPESKHTQLRIRICSASRIFLIWLSEQISKQFKTQGGWIHSGNRVLVLSYTKDDSIRIINEIYKYRDSNFLGRKFSIAQKYLDEKAII